MLVHFEFTVTTSDGLNSNSTMKKYHVLISVAATILAGILFSFVFYEEHPPPKLEDGWWAEGSPRAMNESIRPFTIDIPDEVLVDLQWKLKNTRKLTPPIEDSGFSYGFNSNYLEKVVAFWRDHYHWRQSEKRLNSLSHFKTNIEGLDIHFARARLPHDPSNKTVLPLLMVHGWPGSIVEYLKIVPMLTNPPDNPNSFVFELIIPSLPGFGFSDASRKSGLSYVETAQIFDKLMARLGFEQYYIHGEDWGSFIATTMATLYPRRVTGIHTTMAYAQTLKTYLGLLVGNLWPTLVAPQEHAHLSFPLAEKLSFMLQEYGYFTLQTTKPDSIGVALSDSPAGLAAYILEKFSTWTKRKYINEDEGGLEKSFSMTELLDNVMIYWVTNTITSSMRIYKEGSSPKTWSYHIDRVPCVVPTGISVFPEDLYHLPQSLITSKYTKLIMYDVKPTGGHFAAFEQPQMTADDIWKFVAQVESGRNN